MYSESSSRSSLESEEKTRHNLRRISVSEERTMIRMMELGPTQTALAIFTTEAEYVSPVKACQQALLMKQALVDYDIKLNDIHILSDNKGAIDLIYLYHDGVFVKRPLEYTNGDFKLVDEPLAGLKPLKTDEDVENTKKQAVKTPFKADANDDAPSTYENLEDLKDIVDFEVEGEENVVIPENTTDDPWHNKLVRKGNFIGHIEDPITNLGGRFIHEENDLEDSIVDPNGTLQLEIEDRDDDKNYFRRMYICFKAMGRDGNNQMYPLAWAMVGLENKDNWAWFLSLLQDDLELGYGGGVIILSDGHKGLIEVVSGILPDSEHRQCTRHIYANFKRKWSGLQYKRLFYGATSCIIKQQFLKKMKQIKELDPPAHKCLVERHPNSWWRAFFEMDRCSVAFENGISESFNSWIIQARELGVNEFFSKQAWYNAYQDSIRPVPGSKLWKPCENPSPLPPIERKRPGRTRNQRIRNPTEDDNYVSKVGRVMHCHTCWEVGHNKKGCQNKPRPKPPGISTSSKS
ncbi:zinc finger, PMZ-type containing protein [Tanacetum coccineum]